MTDILAPLAAIHAPDQTALNHRAQSSLAMVQAMEIDSQETYELAADELKAIKSKAKTLEEQRTAITGPINNALKAVNALFKSPASFLEDAERIIKGKMLAYTTEQERIAAAERRAQEAAIRAEQERLAKEAAEREAAAASEAAALMAAGDENGAAEVQAKAAIEAISLASVSTVMTVTQAAPAVAKVSGVSTRTTWKAETINKAELVAYVAANPQFLHLLDVNTSALNQLAKAMKETLALPGVRVFEEKTLASSRS